MRTRRVMLRPKGVELYRADYWDMSLLRDWPLYPFCVEETRRRIPFRFRGGCSPFLMLVLLVDGRMRYTCSDRIHNLEPGRLLVVPLDCDYAFESESVGGYYHKMVFEVKGVHLASIADALGLGQARLLDCQDHERMVERLRGIGAALAAQREEDIPSIMGLTYELLNQVSLLAHDAPKVPRLLAAARARLESRLEEPLSVPELAAGLGVSCATINRLFRGHLNTTPRKYRALRRMDKACGLLEQSSLSVKEIADRVGYCSQFHFTNEFRRLTGRTPSSCRPKPGSI